MLHVQGPVPSFKTGKRGTICKTASGKIYARPITSKKHLHWMEETIAVFASQLRYLFEQETAATQTAHCPLCWIARSVPSNDSPSFIAALAVNVTITGAHEGAIIEIEPV